MTRGTYLPSPRTGLSFGDICRADFLYDAFVHADSRGLIRDELSAAFAQKKGWGSWPIPYYVPVADADQGLVLAHGSPHLAVCLSDDCLITSALGREGEPPGGRLLFAPLAAATQKDLDDLREFPTFGRFALPADDVDNRNWIVALRNCFMVDARAISARLPSLAILSLAETTRTNLANQWAAYACRRGPIVIEDNAAKVAELLVRSGVPEEEARALMLSVASTAAAAWAFEGRAIERAGQIADDGGDSSAALTLLEEGLAALNQRVQASIEALRRVGRPRG